jgi:hypothetical protein
MASQALRMLVVAAISWLLVGQGQAANVLRDEPLPAANAQRPEQLLNNCVIPVARALEQVSIPPDVANFIRTSRIIQPNIFQAYYYPACRAEYQSLARPKRPSGCLVFLDMIEASTQQQDAECYKTAMDVIGQKYNDVVANAQLNVLILAEAAMICFLLDY